MTERNYDSWQKCMREGCVGIQLAASRMCLAHASDQEQAAALRFISGSGVVDVRGVPLSNALFERVLAAVPRDNGKPVLKASRFDRATFTGDAGFGGVTFTGDAGFREATFTGLAGFDGATFTGDARFSGATFSGFAEFDGAIFAGLAGFEQATFTDAWFGGATFKADAWFQEATFDGDAIFPMATFTGDATFDQATFGGGARFRMATFTGRAIFHGATFTGRAIFHGATFTRGVRFDSAAFGGFAGFEQATFTSDARFGQVTFAGETTFDQAIFMGVARFNEVTFCGPAEFGRTHFEQTREFGPLLAYRGLRLDDVQFAQRVQIEISATGVCCRRARFPSGVQFRLRWARVVLDDSDFPAPSLLSGVPRLSSEMLALREERIAQAWQRLLGGNVSEQPQLVSLRQANVAGLGLSNVSVADCLFADAHNLATLRLEGNVAFAAAPAPLGRLSWEGRQVIAEERAWRADRRPPWGWTAPSWPDWLGQRPDVLDPSQIAGLYRALRKGREDIKDEPGAADFYYGETEMRRRARPTVGSTAGTASRGRAERGLLTAYWLVSGYGLRAWRALACLAIITALFAVAFHLVGFAKPPQPVSYWTSLLYSFRATLSLTDSDVQLTAWGQLLQGLLRITGPVLLGLALLALRGRVRR